MTTTASAPGGDNDEVTMTVAWPETANTEARVANIHAYQWDQDRTGVYLLMGHVGIPLWLAPDDRQRWEKAHPDRRVAVEPLGAFYMTTKVARDFCKGLASHLGLTVVEEASGATS